jgi:hypothetical protein
VPKTLIAKNIHLIGDMSQGRVGIMSYNRSYFTDTIITNNRYTISGIPDNSNLYNKKEYNGEYLYSGSNLKINGTDILETSQYYRLFDVNANIIGYTLNSTASNLIIKLPFFMYVTRIRWWFPSFSSTAIIHLSGSSDDGTTWVNITDNVKLASNDSQKSTLLSEDENDTTIIFANTYNYFKFTFTSEIQSVISYLDFAGDVYI